MPDSPRPRDGPGDPNDPNDTNDGDGRGDGSDDGEDWRFELSSLDGDAEGDADARAERPPLEPGSPSAENVFFVLVGVALTLLLVLSAFVPLPLVA